MLQYFTKGASKHIKAALTSKSLSLSQPIQVNRPADGAGVTPVMTAVVHYNQPVLELILAQVDLASCVLSSCIVSCPLVLSPLVSTQMLPMI